MKLFAFLAAATAFVIFADYSAYHPESKPLFLGLASIAVGVIGVVAFVTQPRERRNGGRK